MSVSVSGAKYQTLASTAHSNHAASGNLSTNLIVTEDAEDNDNSLQPYPIHTASDSFSHSNGIDIANDPHYNSIESYNKNTMSQQQKTTHSQQELQKQLVATPRSQSPIPVLLRSASSLLSRSMRLPPGSLRASTFTVITGMVGGGTFTFPYGIYKAGMIPGFIYLLLISSLAGYTTHAIVYCAEQNNCPSFRTLAKKLFGNKLAIFIQICLSILLWMACISYMTLTKNLLSTAVSQLLHDNDNKHWYDNSVLLLLIASVLPTYLALQRKVSALRYASLFGLLVVIFSMLLVVITFFRWCNDEDPQGTPSPTPHPTLNPDAPTRAPTANDNPGYDRHCFTHSISDKDYYFNSDLLGHSYTIALFFGGFAAQFTVLPIYFEMQKRSPRNMTKCIASGFSITFFIYVLVAYFGYWTFPNLVDPDNDQNLITLYQNDTTMLIAQILLALYVMSIIPLFAHAFRKSLTELIHAKVHKAASRNIQQPAMEDEDGVVNADSDTDDETRVDDAEIIEDAVENPHLAYVPVTPTVKMMVEKNKQNRERRGTLSKMDAMELPLLHHVLVTMIFLISVFIVAMFASNIGQVNTIISSTTLPIVCFIFPFMCTLKTDNASLRMKLLTGVMALFSVFNAVMFFYNLLANI